LIAATDGRNPRCLHENDSVGDFFAGGEGASGKDGLGGHAANIILPKRSEARHLSGAKSKQV
jgi:hypothetical protein